MRLHTVDAFTDRPFGGNSAGVVELDAIADAGWMQAVAAELGQATTAFVAPADDGWDLRWFTAEVELPLCGHATLATVHVLAETGRAAPGDVLRFATAAGPLTAVVEDDGRIWLDLPSAPLDPLDDPAATARAVGLDEVVWAGVSDHEHVLIAASPAAVRALVPDVAAVLALPVERVIVTAEGGDGADVTSRVFPPRSGLEEDAVTGSAHAVLGPLWAARLGRDAWVGDQASARGGQVAVRLGTDGRVDVGGQAVTISRGELAVSPG
jgi:PhzF family phenazine biosynthesis protein